MGMKILHLLQTIVVWTVKWLLRRKAYQLKLAAFVVVAFIISRKDLNIEIGMNGIAFSDMLTLSTPTNSEPIYLEEEAMDALPTNVSTIAGVPQAVTTSVVLPAEPAAKPKEKPSSNSDNTANTYSNMAFKGKIATSDSDQRRAEKRKKQLAYVERFYKVAQAEQEKFSIPASITLAQGLIESNCGESKLSIHNNNHFGIKCFSRSCKKGHCSNFTDDTHKDFFRKYASAWESYRSHSYLLQADRYKSLKKLGSKDYKGWARGLKEAGYATDKTYDEKLIQLIEDLELHKYD